MTHISERSKNIFKGRNWELSVRENNKTKKDSGLEKALLMHSSPQNEKSLIIYSPSCRIKPL